MQSGVTKPPDEHGDFLQAYLERILSGQETVESLFSHSPDTPEALRPPLEAAVWLHKRNNLFDPKPDFVSASRRRLVRQIQDQGIGTQSRPKKLGLFENLSVKRIAFPMAVLFAIVVVLFLVNGSLALVLKQTTPEDKLYPIKLAQERLSLVISMTEAGDARLRVELTQRRLQELQSAINAGRVDLISQAVTNFDAQMNMTIRAIESLGKEDEVGAGILAVGLEEVLDEYTIILTSLLKTSEGVIRLEISKALAVTQNGLSALQNMRFYFPATPILPPTSTPPKNPTATPTERLIPTATTGFTGVPSITNTPNPVQQPGLTATPKPSIAPEVKVTETIRPKNAPKPTNTHRPTHKPTQKAKP